eukprot:363597-Chlamydomonas_euryale.AAC.7
MHCVTFKAAATSEGRDLACSGRDHEAGAHRKGVDAPPLARHSRLLYGTDRPYTCQTFNCNRLASQALTSPPSNLATRSLLRCLTD